MGKKLSNKYSQKLLDSAKKPTADAIKSASKRAIQKTAETTGDLIGNKIADKIISVSNSPKELHPNKSLLKQMRMKQIYQKKGISPKKDNKLLRNYN